MRDLRRRMPKRDRLRQLVRRGMDRKAAAVALEMIDEGAKVELEWGDAVRTKLECDQDMITLLEGFFIARLDGVSMKLRIPDDGDRLTVLGAQILQPAREAWGRIAAEDDKRVFRDTMIRAWAGQAARLLDELVYRFGIFHCSVDPVSLLLRALYCFITHVAASSGHFETQWSPAELISFVASYTINSGVACVSWPCIEKMIVVNALKGLAQ